MLLVMTDGEIMYRADGEVLGVLVEEPKALVVKDVDEELSEVLDVLVAPGV